MTKTISASKGRQWLMAIIGVGLIVAILYLFLIARGGAIGSKNLLNASVKFLGFYVPLLSLVATFFFKGGHDSNKPTPAGSFYCAIFIVSAWALVPILLLLSWLPIEDILDYIDKLTPFGQSLALMALGYYFATK